jgi:hypothetical protein
VVSPTDPYSNILGFLERLVADIPVKMPTVKCNVGATELVNLTITRRHGSGPLSIHLTLDARGRRQPVTPGAAEHGPSPVARVVLHKREMRVLCVKARTYYGHAVGYWGRPSSCCTKINILNTLYCILASCYIRLTLNICSFVRRCNTFTS